MAQAQTVRFSGYRVLLETVASPGDFAAPCGFTERAFNLSKELGESNVPDCSDEDGASWTERDVVSKSAEISGQGMLDIVALATWQGFFDSDVSRNARVEIWRNGAKVGHWQGLFQLETFESSATKGERVSVSVSMQSDGVVAWTPV